MSDDNKAEALALIHEIMGSVKKVSNATVQMAKAAEIEPDVALRQPLPSAPAGVIPKPPSKSPSPAAEPAAPVAASAEVSPPAKTASQQDVMAALLRKKGK